MATEEQLIKALETLKDVNAKGSFEDTYRNLIIDRCIQKIKDTNNVPV